MPLDDRVADDPALTRMNDAQLATLPATHVAGHKPHTARSAMTGAAVVRQIDSVAESCVQQQLTMACDKALTINLNPMTSCH
jgi:hypothetical protein